MTAFIRSQQFRFGFAFSARSKGGLPSRLCAYGFARSARVRHRLRSPNVHRFHRSLAQANRSSAHRPSRRLAQYLRAPCSAAALLCPIRCRQQSIAAAFAPDCECPPPMPPRPCPLRATRPWAPQYSPEYTVPLAL